MLVYRIISAIGAFITGFLIADTMRGNDND